uniref:Reverse transcriptase domain-containing protein n=1 Tax=Megaselia scalaris TaxID=36166 RepID=T1GCX7_MEGSC
MQQFQYLPGNDHESIQLSDIENKSSQILGYADDIDVIGRTKLDVDSIFLEIEKVASFYGLMINGNNTK